jgi:dihydrofolate synthase/folylpolyglutamate synthase
MAGIVCIWHVCGLGVERGAPAEQVRAELHRFDVETFRIRESCDPLAAYHLALEEAGECDRIIVFGSFHTVAPVLAHECGPSC